MASENDGNFLFCCSVVDKKKKKKKKKRKKERKEGQTDRDMKY